MGTFVTDYLRPFQLIVNPSAPPRPEVVGTTPPNSCRQGENNQRCRQPKIIDVNATEGLNLSTTQATQDGTSEVRPSTSPATNIDTGKTTQDFLDEIRSTTQVPITSTLPTKSIFFTTPKILVITPKVKIEEENSHFTTVTSKVPMQFHTEHEDGKQPTLEQEKSKVQVGKEHRQPKLARPNSQNEITPPSTGVQFKVPTKLKEEKSKVKIFTPKPLVQFYPSIQPFTSSDAINPLRQEIATEHMKFNPHKMRTKSPRIPFFGPNSFRPSPKIPSNMFVPVQPIVRQPDWECGSECGVPVQNVTFKTVKPFIRAEASTKPSTFQGWWSTILTYYSTNII